MWIIVAKFHGRVYGPFSTYHEADIWLNRQEPAELWRGYIPCTLTAPASASASEPCIHPGVFASPDNPVTHCSACDRDIPRQEL
jgi:hypothetical protein